MPYISPPLLQNSVWHPVITLQYNMQEGQASKRLNGAQTQSRDQLKPIAQVS